MLILPYNFQSTEKYDLRNHYLGIFSIDIAENFKMGNLR